MRYTLIALAWLILAGCVTTDSENISGWSFYHGKPSQPNKSYNYNVVSKDEGHPVRSGDTSFRFEVRSGDCGTHKSGWDDCKQGRERRERGQLGYDYGENWYAWSIYLPDDFPGMFGQPVLGQWHYNEEGAHDGGPVAVFFRLMLVRVPGTRNEYKEAYVVDPLFGGPRDQVIAYADDMKGKWTDVLVHINWSHKDDGFFRVYANGDINPILSYTGINRMRYPSSTRLLDVYFKFGIYRGRNDDTQVAYYDDVRKGKSCKDVGMYFDCDRIVVG